MRTQASNQARARRQEPWSRDSGRRLLGVTPAAYYTGLDRVRCAAVGPSEKACQQVRRLDRGTPVEGHQRGPSAGQCDQMRPPPVGPYSRHLDLVNTAVDGLFETV